MIWCLCVAACSSPWCGWHWPPSVRPLLGCEAPTEASGASGAVVVGCVCRRRSHGGVTGVVVVAEGVSVVVLWFRVGERPLESKDMA